jgi:hypothetical protein
LACTQKRWTELKTTLESVFEELAGAVAAAGCFGFGMRLATRRPRFAFLLVHQNVRLF